MELNRSNTRKQAVRFHSHPQNPSPKPPRPVAGIWLGLPLRPVLTANKPPPPLRHPDFRNFLKRVRYGCQTKPIAQISKALHRNDPADYWDAFLTPLIRRFLSTAGTSEFGHFQKTHEFPRQRHPPVAYAWERELAVCEVVRPRRCPGGAMSPPTLLTTSGHCPGVHSLFTCVGLTSFYFL